VCAALCGAVVECVLWPCLCGCVTAGHISNAGKMRQIGILPAGCQISGKSILYADHNRIYYASTLSIYVYSAKTYLLEKVIAISEKTVCGLSVSALNPDLVATVSCDGCGSLWRLSDSSLISRANTSIMSRLNIVLMELNSTNCVIVVSEPHVRLLFWDTSKVMSPLVEIFAVKKANLKATCAAWNPSSQNRLAIGCNNSWILLFNTKDKSQNILQVAERTTPIVQLQWDKLSSVYLVAAYRNFLSLWDTEALAELHVFEKQHSPITGIAWLDWTAGNFISTNEKSGIGKIWNVSQKQPLESVKISTCGIIDCFVSATTKSVVTANSDGSVSVFNLQRKQLEFCIPAGHTDTVFDCAFDPTTPEVFATCSYDGTVKIWNTATLTLVKTLRGPDAILYNCSWSRNGKYIAASASTGHIILWDVDTGKQILDHPLHAKASYSIAWSKSSDGLFCSTSADGTAVVVRLNSDALFGPPRGPLSSASPGNMIAASNTSPGAMVIFSSPQKSSPPQAAPELTESSIEIEMKYLHPAAVYGCSWCNHHPNILATGCQDGHVRVFDYTTPVDSPLLFDLQGHSRRSFNVVWSSLEKGLLASGSDDATIIVWKVDIESIAIRFSGVKPTVSSLESSSRESKHASSTVISPMKQLLGHKSNVRAITFSSEHRQILISGSWDATIRIWDINLAQCIKVIAGHVADVYGVIAHPERPFTYISCSRDTTIRVWEMQGVMSLLRMTAVLDLKMDRVIAEAPSPVLGDSPSTSPARSVKSLAGPLLAILGFGSDPASSASTAEAKDGSDGPRASSYGVPSPSALRPVLSGRGSTRLQQALTKLQRDEKRSKLVAAECYYRLYSFFTGANGCMDLWEAVLMVLSRELGEPSPTPSLARSSSSSTVGLAGSTASVSGGATRLPSQRTVFHEDEVLAKTFEDATKRAAKRRGADRNDELVIQAALMHAKCGNFESYCNMMVSLNEWAAALSVAPRVSMSFWRSLASQYADYLQSVSSEECVPYYLCSNRGIEATAFYLRRREINNAFIVADSQNPKKTRSRNSNILAESDDDTFDMDMYEENPGQGARASAGVDSASMNDGPQANGSILRSNNPAAAGAMIRSVFAFSAKSNINASKPIIAAAQYVAAGEFDQAVNLLLACGEVDLAYAVGFCLNRLNDSIFIAFANEFGKLGAVTVGIEVLRSVQNSEIHIGLLGSKYLGTNKGRVLTTISRDQWLRKAAEEEAIGNDMDATLTFVLGLDYSQAIAVGLSALRKTVREPLDLSASHRRIVSYLKCIRLGDVDEGVRISFFAHMLWFGAHEAAESGLWEAAYGMLK
jgi:WD40 repeat protein